MQDVYLKNMGTLTVRLRTNHKRVERQPLSPRDWSTGTIPCPGDQAPREERARKRRTVCARANFVQPAHRLASRGRGLRGVRPRAAAVPGRWAGPAVGSSWRSREAAARAGGGDASLTGEARPRGRGSAGARGQGRPPVGAFRRGSRGRGVPTCAEPGPPAWRFARGALAEGEPGAGARGFLPASARDRTRALHGVGDWPVVTRGTEVPLLPLPRRNQDEYDSSPGSGGRSGGAGGGPALRLHPQDRGGTPGRVLQVSAAQRQRGSRGAEKRVRGVTLESGKWLPPPRQGSASNPRSGFIPAVGN